MLSVIMKIVSEKSNMFKKNTDIKDRTSFKLQWSF